MTQKPVISFVLDPYLQTADIDLSNNAFPRQPTPSRFELFEQRQGGNNAKQPLNPMQQLKRSPLQQKEEKPLNTPLVPAR